jgi:acyl dehydratase
MIDRAYIGRVLPAHTVEVEKGRLRFFAKAIGERNPVYSDETAARAAGFCSLPVPPTFLFSLDNEKADPFAYLTEMGVDLRRILHGEQSFTYRAPVCAGEMLTFSSRIADIYSKKGGALEFVVKETTVSNSAGTMVAELRSVIVLRGAGQGA